MTSILNQRWIPPIEPAVVVRFRNTDQVTATITHFADAQFAQES